MRSPPPLPPSEKPLDMFEARRALSTWEKVGLVVGALLLLSLWAEVLGLAATGNPWGHFNFKLQWVGTHQLVLLACFGTLAWGFALWRHVLARNSTLRRVLGLPQLRGVVVIEREVARSSQNELF